VVETVRVVGVDGVQIDQTRVPVVVVETMRVVGVDGVQIDQARVPVVVETVRVVGVD
jgi:hypothetical protein